MIATSRKSGDVKAFRASGPQIEPVDLLSRDGLIEHLAALEPALHPGEALSRSSFRRAAKIARRPHRSWLPP